VLEDDAMTTMTISVPGIHCDHCKHSIEGALATLPGVRSAQVDIDARTVTVEVDEAHVDRAGLVAAIEDQGYDVPA
jgi:copper chaperone